VSWKQGLNLASRAANCETVLGYVQEAHPPAAANRASLPERVRATMPVRLPNNEGRAARHSGARRFPVQGFAMADRLLPVEIRHAVSPRLPNAWSGRGATLSAFGKIIAWRISLSGLQITCALTRGR
jgi:hypothetical protein